MDTNVNLTSSSSSGGDSGTAAGASSTTATTATLFDCLVAWVTKFEFVPHERELTVNDFKDGVLIAKCLNSIDPDYFSEEWISKIKSDTNENWRLKLLNLKKILQTLTDYYSEVLNYSLADFEKLNLNLIVETNNNTSSKEVTDQLSHLLQLVLGCAVNCERKSEFIQNIMEMEESSQHMLMTAIQELMTKDPNSNSILKSSSLALAGLSSSEDFGYQLKKSLAEVTRLSEIKDDLEDKCKVLEKKVDELSEDKIALLNEIDLIKVKLTERESLARNESNNDLNKQLKMQQKLDSTLEELYKLESEKEKYRIQYETAKAEQTSLIEKNIELNKMVQENQSLKDEIDVLKHNSDRVEKLESIIASYKIKLEEMSDLKKQMRALEESNSTYLEKILLLEEEVKKVASYKSQIDMYKKQIQELHEKMLSDEMKMKKLEYEYKNMEETCNSLTNEKNSLMWSNNNNNGNHGSSRDTRSPTLDEPDSAIILRSSSPKSNLSQSMDDVFSSIELVNIPSEIREKVMRLCHENKLLKSRQGEMTDERLTLLEAKFEDEKQRNVDLQSRLNEANRQRIELEYHLNNSSNSRHHQTATSGVMSMSNSFNSLSQLSSMMDTSGGENSETRRRNELSALSELENMCKFLRAENESLRKTIEDERNSKLKELQNCEAKYVEYLEKAKLVIKSLDPVKLNSGDNHADPGEIELLRRQLTERDKHIKQLMTENQKLKDNHEKEEQLIASAWYKLGEGLNRKAQDDRTASIGNSSFLSQQRQLPSSTSNNMISAGGGQGPTSVYLNSNYYNNNRHRHHNNNNNTSPNNSRNNMVRNVGPASIL